MQGNYLAKTWLALPSLQSPSSCGHCSTVNRESLKRDAISTTGSNTNNLCQASNPEAFDGKELDAARACCKEMEGSRLWNEVSWVCLCSGVVGPAGSSSTCERQVQR